ncbi:FG-GAP-like repeat-containing protein [Roseateles sp. 22389]|uniref:FG-GAP-like repeat-containing protein n=1 Tax=Roseateles sp. 22389 TaxID=3453916 RepID=UPI003F87D1E4
MKRELQPLRGMREAGHASRGDASSGRLAITALRWAGRAACAALAMGTLAVWAQTAVPITPPNLTGGVAGSLSGQAGVSSGGAATYSVALTLPPGTAGLSPTLSLDYSSQSGMSSMGFGWRLDGLSQITRCPKTIVQDGVRRGVTLTAEDQFCLDGQRLLMVAGSGAHGAAAEYRVQIDSQSQVKSFGSDPAKGPDYFEVRSRKGLVFTYGKTADATIEAQGTGKPVLTWALSRVMDRRGNYYDVRYSESNTATLGEAYPERVLYTGHIDQGGGGGNQAPYNAVRFIYEDRPDLQLAYVAGSRLTNSKRLTAVRTYTGTDVDGNGGTLARDFRIGYVVNATNGRSLVDTLKDCDGAGNCLPATTFSWTKSDPAGSAGADTGSGNWGGPQVALTSLTIDGDRSQQVKSQVVMGDFNGDGMVDLMRGDGSNWQVCLSTGSGFNCSNWMPSSALTRDIVTGDFNGDGKTDVAVYPKVDGPGTWTVCLSTGSSFSCGQWPGYGASNYYANGQTSGALVGDFNGDGRDDIAIAGPNGDNERICWSTGSGFRGGTCQNYPGSFLFMYAAKLQTEESVQSFQTGQMSVDIDGDGRADVIQYFGTRRNNPSIYPKGAWMGIRATDAGFVSFSAASTGQMLLDGVTSPGDSRAADVTGDSYGGLSDVVNGYITDGTNPARMELCRSNGLTLVNCLALPGAGGATGPVSYLRDLDGDGRPDIVAAGQVCQLQLSAYGAGNTDQYTLACAPRPAGSGAGDTSPALVSYAGDFNGDGRPDSASYIMTSNTTGYWRVYLSSHVGFADMLDTVTNGVGQPIRFSYKRQSDSSIYTPGAAVSYPKRNLVGGTGALVSSMQTGNGVGGWLTTDYAYEAARADLSGRGALGFEKRRVIDRTKGITTQTTVSQDFPTIGMPLETRSTQTNGTVLSLSSVSYGSVAMAAGAVCPYPTSSTLQTRDLNGTAIATTSSSVAAGGVDAYCNVTDASETVSTSDGASFATRTVTSYLNNPAAWLIGLPTNVAVTKTAVQPYAAANALSLTACVSSVPTNAAATFSCTLANGGPDAATGLGYSSGSGTTVSGPPSCAGNSANCGVVVVTSTASPATYSGTLRVTAGNSASVASTTYTLTVTTPPALALSNCSSSAPTTSAATMSCRLSNGGQTAASGIAYAAGSGVTVSGPASCPAGSADCGVVTVTSSGAPGVYNGTISATPASGNAASAGYSLTVYTSSALTLSGCSSSSPTTSAATMTCTLGNTGQTAAGSIVYGTASGASASGPSSCAAGTANCGAVTVSTSGSPGSYSGTLTATPASGSGASAAYSLTVYTPPALTLASCVSSSPTTAAATMSCTLGNSGQTTASGIAYGAGSGASAGGPSTCAAGSSNCGTVTVTTSGSAGNYGGTLTATPGNGGSGASTGYSLAVYTPPALGLANCASTAPSSSVGSMSCTLINSGQTSASGVSYGAGSGVSVGGPSSCAAGSSNCGAVTVTSAANPGTYAGTLSASPTNGGSGASAGYSLVVFTPPALRFAGCSATSPSTAVQTFTCNLANDGQAATSVGYASGSGTSVSGPGVCAGSSANCGAVVVSTSSTPGLYSGALTVSALSGGTGVGTGYSLRVYSNGTTLSASPMTLDWGTLTGGSPTKSLTIQNTGLAPTTLSWSLAYTAGSIGMGNYSVVTAQSSCTSGQSLDIGQSCTVTWAMNTQCTTKGVRSAKMTINGGTSAVVVSMSANVQRTTLCQ